MKKIVCAALAALCGLVFSAAFPPPSQAQSKKVLVQLAWVVGGGHTGFFVAKEKGFNIWVSGKNLMPHPEEILR